MRRFLALVVLLFGLGGAARPVVHPAHITPTPKYVTNAVLQGIPLVRQGYNQCGPASLQMVLAFWGLGMDQTAIGALTKPDPRAYMGAAAIGTFASGVGLASTTVRGGSLNMVRAFLAQGVPVIALSFFNTPGEIPHWRVVSGFDDKQGVVFGCISLSWGRKSAMAERIEGEWSVTIAPEGSQRGHPTCART